MQIDWSANYWGPLSTMIGALLGALITGFVAIHVMKQENLLRKKERDDNFKKTFVILKKFIPSAFESLKNIFLMVQDKNADKKRVLEIELSSLKENISRLNSINDDYIPQEIYEDFLDIKSLMEMVSYQLSAYIPTIQLVVTKTHVTIVSENIELKQWILANEEVVMNRLKDKFEKIKIYRTRLK